MARWSALPVGRPLTRVRALGSALVSRWEFISHVGAGLRSELGSLIWVEFDNLVPTFVGCIFAKVEDGPTEAWPLVPSVQATQGTTLVARPF
jgi:hypothetical protein